MNFTVDQIKHFLQEPLALFVIMLLASLANAIKQKRTANKSGATMSLVEYLSYVRETVYTVLMNALAFILLLATDQLNAEAPLGLKLAAAMGIGFGANSISDMLTKGGRSDALVASSAPTRAAEEESELQNKTPPTGNGG